MTKEGIRTENRAVVKGAVRLFRRLDSRFHDSSEHAGISESMDHMFRLRVRTGESTARTRDVIVNFSRYQLEEELSCRMCLSRT